MKTALTTLKGYLLKPGTLFYRNDFSRSLYKFLLGPVTLYRTLTAASLFNGLPPVPAELRLTNQAYKVHSPEKFAELTKPLLERCHSIFASSAGVPKEGKKYLHHMIGPKEVATHPEFLRFALHPEMVAIARDYLGGAPLIGEMSYWVASPLAEDFDGSQLFHIDNDDVRQLKVFVFVSDVDESNGPLTIVDAENSAVVKKKWGYDWKRRSRIPDAFVKDLTGSEAITPLLGKEGTVAFVDTSRCFHYGSRCATNFRHMFLLQYISPVNFRQAPVLFQRYPFRDAPVPVDCHYGHYMLNGKV